ILIGITCVIGKGNFRQFVIAFLFHSFLEQFFRLIRVYCHEVTVHITEIIPIRVYKSWGYQTIRWLYPIFYNVFRNFILIYGICKGLTDIFILKWFLFHIKTIKLQSTLIAYIYIIPVD